MERIVTLEELRTLRKTLSDPNLPKDKYEEILSIIGSDFGEQDEKDASTSFSKEGAKALVKTNPSAPSLLEKTGFSNVIYLATISLVFEVIFLAVSLLIYK